MMSQVKAALSTYGPFAIITTGYGSFIGMSITNSLRHWGLTHSMLFTGISVYNAGNSSFTFLAVLFSYYWLSIAFLSFFPKSSILLLVIFFKTGFFFFYTPPPRFIINIPLNGGFEGFLKRMARFPP